VAALSIGDSVTGDFLRVALDGDSGRLKHCGVLAEAARGALLIDLARLGRLSHGPDGASVDTTPTGLAVADELLEAVDAHPTRAMQVMLQRGVPHLHELIAELIAEGYWTVRRHGILAGYADRDADRFARSHRDLVAIIGGTNQPIDARQAALAALINVTGLGDPSPYLNKLPDHLLKSCQELGWIVADVTGFLYDAQATALASGLSSGVTTGIQLGSV
jgi:Golgi phosphoprotein 3 (GPP34)